MKNAIVNRADSLLCTSFEFDDRKSLQKKSKNLPDKMLINSVSTRWNSEYLMKERIFKQVDNVNEVLFATRKHCHLVLKLSEKNILKLIADVFEPFYSLTKKISCEKYPSCNVIFYSIFSLRKKYARNNSDTNAVGKFLK
ncbi:zinc finger BED domain-containing 1-like [Brachionus plicatilis]|uniref:Zinc finger BED domain-containing 1-like n=1 Tax=Brachionus plicatilis TaxID=10195 RepID=A0A3M7RRJ7_BRAPC|nr:zinc finger BED domain-containing 1-like [Brachionus plicatilis]